MAITVANAIGCRKERKIKKASASAPTSKARRNTTLAIEFGLFTKVAGKMCFSLSGRTPMYPVVTSGCNSAERCCFNAKRSLRLFPGGRGRVAAGLEFCRVPCRPPGEYQKRWSREVKCRFYGRIERDVVLVHGAVSVE